MSIEMWFIPVIFMHLSGSFPIIGLFLWNSLHLSLCPKQAKHETTSTSSKQVFSLKDFPWLGSYAKTFCKSMTLQI